MIFISSNEPSYPHMFFRNKMKDSPQHPRSASELVRLSSPIVTLVEILDTLANVNAFTLQPNAS